MTDRATETAPFFVKARQRLEEDDEAFDDEPEIDVLVNYLDFGESYSLLNYFKEDLPKDLRQYLQARTVEFEALVPMRNRVMHTRPLQADDFPAVLEFAKRIVRENPPIWKHLRSVLRKLKEDSSFVMGLKIPNYAVDKPLVHHNLPLPDFDETGFIGRRQEEQMLNRALRGAYPVISVVGEGGQGKTALALKAAYEVVYSTDCPYRAVVWTTAKSTQLTPVGIRSIEGAITDSIGVMSGAASALSLEYEGDPFGALIDLIKDYPVLLILDNLETILDDNIRDFLERLPSGSKVLITSRIGLGAFEYPVRLAPMQESDSLQLLRSVARARDLTSLVSVPNDRLVAYCRRMKNNPGYIKWFISAVQAGSRPEAALSNPDVFLDFCLANVYRYLTDEARKILTSMQCVPRPLSQAELSILNNMDPVTLQRSLQQLLSANMLAMASTPSGVTFETTYAITELTRDYLAKHHPPYPSDAERYGKRWRRLMVEGDDLKASLRTNPYSWGSIKLRSDRDLPVAGFLIQALSHAKGNKMDAAEEALQKARQLAPDYFEVHRIEAIIRYQQQNFLSAKGCYEAAIELEPNYAPIRHFYAGLLSRELDDLDAAHDQLIIAKKLDESAFEIDMEIARIQLYRREYASAKASGRALAERTSLPEWAKRRIWDLLLQVHQREALQNYRNLNYDKALSNMLDLQREYQSIPAHYRDSRMKEKLRKVQFAADGCVRRLIDPGRRQSAVALLQWLQSVAPDFQDRLRPRTPGQRHVGKVRMVHYHKGFGFIETDVRDFYFNQRDVEDDLGFEDLHIGRVVEFEEGVNSKGPCARRISSAEELGRRT